VHEGVGRPAGRREEGRGMSAHLSLTFGEPAVTRLLKMRVFSPKPGLPVLEAWATSMRPSIDALRGTVCGTVRDSL
jgi:hypothetical protein